MSGDHSDDATALVNRDTTSSHTGFWKIRLGVHGNIPTRQTSGSAGYDIASSEDVVIPAHGLVRIHTDIFLQELPPNTFVKLESRSGLAFRSRLSVRGGIIDNDYRGEIMVLLANEGNEDYCVRAKERIAQAIVLPYYTLPVVLVDKNEEHNNNNDEDSSSSKQTSERGVAGFGSTGK
jgi:dUTP pyrophosphatase